MDGQESSETDNDEVGNEDAKEGTKEKKDLDMPILDAAWVPGDNAEEHEDDEEVQEKEEYEIDPEQDQEGGSEDYEFDGPHDPEDEVKEYYAEVEEDCDEQDGHREEG